MDAVDRSIESPIADSASSSRGCEKRQFRDALGIEGGATCCAQCSAGRIPVGLDGFAARGGHCAGDFDGGDLSAILGGSEFPDEMKTRDIKLQSRSPEDAASKVLRFEGGCGVWAKERNEPRSPLKGRKSINTYPVSAGQN